MISTGTLNSGTLTRLVSYRSLITVRVRIAVVIDDRGRYNACGWSGAEEPARWARDGLDRGDGAAQVEEVHFIEAEIPLPAPHRARVITGTIEPARAPPLDATHE